MAHEMMPRKMIKSPMIDASPSVSHAVLTISTNVPTTATKEPSHQRKRGQPAPMSDANSPVTIGINDRMSPACVAVVRATPTLRNVGQMAKLVIPEITSSMRS